MLLTLSRCFSLSLIAVFLCTPVRGEEHTKDKIEEVKKAVSEKKAVMIDVREKSEWDRGHLKAAELMPLSVLKTSAIVDEVKKLPPKETIIYIHCASGYRCLDAAPLLRKLGYDVRALELGYKDLLKAGFEPAPEEKPSTEPKSKI